MATKLRSTSDSVVAQDDTLSRPAPRPFQTVPPHQQVPSFYMVSMTRVVVSSSPKDMSASDDTTKKAAPHARYRRGRTNFIKPLQHGFWVLSLCR